MIVESFRLMKRVQTVFLVLLAFSSILAPTIAAATERTFGEIAGAIVRVKAVINPDARTARSLGTERNGSGVVIGKDGLILTIGYLIMESATLEVTSHTGQIAPADFVAYDHQTGFGLLRARGDFDIQPLELGDPSDLKPGAPLFIISSGQFGGVAPVRAVSRRPFVGYWDYVLDSAIYTMPPHREFAGAALVDLDGQLVGVGSLFVGDALRPESRSPGNLFVPVDLLTPILSQMIDTGRSGQNPRPWLGVHATSFQGRLIINSVAPDGPGSEAGLKVGDIIIGVHGRRVSNLEDMFRKVWSQGDAGSHVSLDILPYGSDSLDIKKVVIRSRDRYGWLRINTN